MCASQTQIISVEFSIETPLSAVQPHMLFQSISRSCLCIYPNPWWLEFKLLFKLIPELERHGLEKAIQRGGRADTSHLSSGEQNSAVPRLPPQGLQLCMRGI